MATNKTKEVDVNEGISPDELKALQENQKEGENAISPSAIAGVSNDPVLDNATLTSKLVDLERRFNNLNLAHHNGNF